MLFGLWLGTLHVGGSPTIVLFDSGATHSFVIPEVVSRFKRTFVVRKVGVSVLTPGNQTLRAEDLVIDVSAVVAERIFSANLFVMPLERYEVILGMDWLSGYKARLDCGKGRISFGEEKEPMITYYGINPSSSVSFVSALRVERELEQGEAYLVTLTVVGEEADEALKIEDIPVVQHYQGVFEPLEGLPPPRSNPFTINLEPGAAPIAKAPY